MTMYSAQPGSIEDWTDLYLKTNDRLGDTERRLARAELMHKRTAEHLRQERKRRRLAECANSGLHRQLRAWYGGETVTSLLNG